MGRKKRSVDQPLSEKLLTSFMKAELEHRLVVQKRKKLQARVERFASLKNDVENELNEMAVLLLALNKNIEEMKDGSLKTESIRRRDAIMLRQSALMSRSPDNRPEVREKIQNDLIATEQKVISYEILKDNAWKQYQEELERSKTKK